MSCTTVILATLRTYKLIQFNKVHITATRSSLSTTAATSEMRRRQNTCTLSTFKPNTYMPTPSNRCYVAVLIGQVMSGRGRP